MSSSPFLVRPLAALLAFLSVLGHEARSSAAADGYPYPALSAFLREQLQAEKLQRLDLCSFAPGLQFFAWRDPRLTPQELEVGCLEDLLVSQAQFLVDQNMAIHRQRVVQPHLDAAARLAQWQATLPDAESMEGGCEAGPSVVLCLYRRFLLLGIDWAYDARGLRPDAGNELFEGLWLLETLSFVVLPAPPPEGPPFNDVREGLQFWGDGSYLRTEQEAMFDLCAATPERLAGDAPDLAPSEDIPPKAWLTMRCLELWLVHQSAVIYGLDYVIWLERDIAEFRAIWRLYWTDYYAMKAGERAVDVPPAERWLPGYLDLLKEWIDGAYTNRLVQNKRW